MCDPSNKANNKPRDTSTVRSNSVGWMLNRLATKINKEMKEALSPLDLNHGQFAIIMTLLENDGISQSEIGRHTLLPGYSTTRNLDVLEEMGIIKRHHDENSRRSFCIRLTQKGQALKPELFKVIKSVNTSFLANLDEHEISRLKETLNKLL